MSYLDADKIYDAAFPGYLILGVKAQLRQGQEYGRVCFPEIFPDRLPSYSITTVRDPKDTFFLHAMILIEAPRGTSLQLYEALNLMHALHAALSIAHFCITRVDREYSLLPLADSLLSIRPPWHLQAIVSQSEPLVGILFSSIEEVELLFGSYHLESIEVLKGIMPLLGKAILDSKAHLAMSYLFESTKQLGWDVCDWREERYDPEATRYVSVGAAESAFQNAYKAIEAIIGDPGKDRSDRKIKTRLQATGLDPFESVGYLVKEPLLERFERYYRMRDSIAAHGSGKKKRPLKMGEIIDLQAMARHILLSYAGI